MAATVTMVAAYLHRVTVLMPVFNGETFLKEAIDSILTQTFSDFEFLIIDDGSTDRSVDIIKSFSDSRICLVQNETNLGLIAALNKGLLLATGEYIARMDCDDISLPQRLAQQVAYLDSHPEVGICGAWFRKFGSGAQKTVRWQLDPESNRCGLLFDSTVGHPTVMMRRELFGKLHFAGYDSDYKNAEDYELWLRASEHGGIANLDKVLLLYRVHPSQITQRQAAGQREAAGRVRLTQLHRMGITPSAQEFEIHQAVSTCNCVGVEDLFVRAEQWLCKLKEANARTSIYEEASFSRVLVDRWLTFCKKAFDQRQWSIRAFFPLSLLRKTGLSYRYLAMSLIWHLRGR